MFGLAGPKLYAAIGGAIVIALFLAWVWRIDSLRASHLKERDAALSGLKISETSLKQCRGFVDDNNRRIDESAKALADAQQKAAADKARSDARYEATGRTISGLEASAADRTQPACAVSQRALQGLEQL